MLDDRICKKHGRGIHIELSCVKHPEAKYSTKNISYIGARSIFSFGGPDCKCEGTSTLKHECK